MNGTWSGHLSKASLQHKQHIYYNTFKTRQKTYRKGHLLSFFGTIVGVVFMRLHATWIVYGFLNDCLTVGLLVFYDSGGNFWLSKGMEGK